MHDVLMQEEGEVVALELVALTKAMLLVEPGKKLTIYIIS